MVDATGRFQATGPTWAERSTLPELNAVLGPDLPQRANHFIDAVHGYAAGMIPSMSSQSRTLLDFGCGTGRFVRYFGQRGYHVVGIDITPEMLVRARQLGVPDGTWLVRTDGISIPLNDASIDVIWCCGVLRFSLFVQDPAYHAIAREMYRVLKPGGLVVNVEVHVDALPQVFIHDFESVGFLTLSTCIMQRYDGWPERAVRRLPMPKALARVAGTWCAVARSRFDPPARRVGGLRDYRFVWMKTHFRQPAARSTLTALGSDTETRSGGWSSLGLRER